MLSCRLDKLLGRTFGVGNIIRLQRLNEGARNLSRFYGPGIQRNIKYRDHNVKNRIIFHSNHPKNPTVINVYLTIRLPVNFGLLRFVFNVASAYSASHIAFSRTEGMALFESSATIFSIVSLSVFGLTLAEMPI